MRLADRLLYLLGMGGRRKLLYRRGELYDALTGERLRAWAVESEQVLPDQYRLEIETVQGRRVEVWEDEETLWLREGDKEVALSSSKVSLPTFAGHPHQALLRTLHQELLVNLLPGGPVPNLLVYPRPWYRDAAMVCMCLAETGNLHLVEPWVMGLREPFDRNNGCCEPDNLGQALYLVSLVSDASHPLVEAVLAALPGVRREGWIEGITDGQPHPVYQTKWLKFGLRALGLDDTFCVPEVWDSYSALFWMDYRRQHVPGPRFDQTATQRYPYLGWAEAHFHGDPLPMELVAAGWPLTWEAEASQARYEGMQLVGEEFVRRRLAAPHTWHAAEMFLYLLTHDQATGQPRERQVLPLPPGE